MTENYVVVQSSEQLQALLAKDLERVSVLNFRADWAEPCKAMDSVSRELATRHPKLLFLEVSSLLLNLF